MAKTTTSRKSQKKEMTKEHILGAFTTYVLEHGHEPTSEYKFCKDTGIEEELFYKYFGSLNSVKRQVWVVFHDNSLTVLKRDKAYDTYSNREKMLSYFFTLFEVLKLNRSYVLFTLNDPSSQNMLKGLDQLKGLRKHLKTFAEELIKEGNDEKKLKLVQHSTSFFSEGAWVQFLLLLKYWMDDDSAGFEKTDVIIEKSVNTVFDVFETKPLESVIDLGKFLWKEHKT